MQRPQCIVCSTRARRVVVALLFVLCLGVGAAPRAHAADDERWYGWQMLPSDLAAWALIGAGYTLMPESGRGPLEYLGVITATLGGPIVHFANGRGGAGLGSLGLRAGALVVAALTVVLSEEPGDPVGERAARSALVVGAAALIAAQIIDLVVVARERAQPQDAASVFGVARGERLLRVGLAF
ncbi:MAG: hypothetical protein KC503_16840 [Myxococcales bacterium]|nr:hypothetical protein [Myxococcales bacterium]